MERSEAKDDPARGPTPGHGDHWLAALAPGDPRLLRALAVPLDAPDALRLHRSDLTEALDLVQVTRKRALVTAYPEPRATTLVRGTPRELHLWETRAEGWLTFEHEGAGVLTVFLTDLAENAPRYAAAGARRGIDLELGGLAYILARASPGSRPPRLQPAARTDARFLPDDYDFDADVVDVRPAGEGEVLDLAVHGGLVLPVATRLRALVSPGERVRGYLWLTGRMPDGPDSKGL